MNCFFYGGHNKSIADFLRQKMPEKKKGENKMTKKRMIKRISKIFAAAIAAGILMEGTLPAEAEELVPLQTVRAVEESGSGFEAYLGGVVDCILKAADGSNVLIPRDKNINSLPQSVMRALVEKGTVSLTLECSYEGKDYIIVIPAGMAVDNDIPWYGPLYLSGRYGNRSAAGNCYIVQSGDTLSRIALNLKTTVAELIARNPQITDPNRIYTGQMLNY